VAALYANENFPRRVVESLRSLGHDVLTTQDAGNAGQAIPDEDVLEYAIRARCAVLTLNRRDFIRLHQRSSEHAGIVVCTMDADIAAQAVRIHQAISKLPTLTGQLIRVNRPWNPT
jgi:predicted nuclease of predicted toxin-antitoxin system